MSDRRVDPRGNSRPVLEGPHRAGARAMLRAFGLTDSDFQKPQIGVAATWNKVTPCNAGLDALRHHGGDAEIELPVEVCEDVLAREILDRIGQALLESRMHMRADDRRHHCLAVEVDPDCARRHRDLALMADARDYAALDQDFLSPAVATLLFPDLFRAFWVHPWIYRADIGEAVQVLALAM